MPPAGRHWLKPAQSKRQWMQSRQIRAGVCSNSSHPALPGGDKVSDHDTYVIEASEQLRRLAAERRRFVKASSRRNARA